MPGQSQEVGLKVEPVVIIVGASVVNGVPRKMVGLCPEKFRSFCRLQVKISSPHKKEHACLQQHTHKPARRSDQLPSSLCVQKLCHVQKHAYCAHCLLFYFMRTHGLCVTLCAHMVRARNTSCRNHKCELVTFHPGTQQAEVPPRQTQHRTKLSIETGERLSGYVARQRAKTAVAKGYMSHPLRMGCRRTKMLSR